MLNFLEITGNPYKLRELNEWIRKYFTYMKCYWCCLWPSVVISSHFSDVNKIFPFYKRCPTFMPSPTLLPWLIAYFTMTSRVIVTFLTKIHFAEICIFCMVLWNKLRVKVLARASYWFSRYCYFKLRVVCIFSKTKITFWKVIKIAILKACIIYFIMQYYMQESVAIWQLSQ